MMGYRMLRFYDENDTLQEVIVLRAGRLCAKFATEIDALNFILACIEKRWSSKILGQSKASLAL